MGSGVKREEREARRREVKIGPQPTQWRLNPAPGPHHVMWATVAGTAESSFDLEKWNRGDGVQGNAIQ